MNHTNISFEVAKLAKEVGFKTHIAHFDKAYRTDGTQYTDVEVGKSPSRIRDEGYQIVSQSELQKWLRETYKIDTCPVPINYTDEIMYNSRVNQCMDNELIEFKKVKTGEEYEFINTCLHDVCLVFSLLTYEEAVEESLKYALKIVKRLKLEECQEHH